MLAATPKHEQADEYRARSLVTALPTRHAEAYVGTAVGRIVWVESAANEDTVVRRKEAQSEERMVDAGEAFVPATAR